MTERARPVFHKGVEAAEFSDRFWPTESREEAPLLGVGGLDPGREDGRITIGFHAEEEAVGDIVLPSVVEVAVPTRALVIKGRGDHVQSLGDGGGHKVTQFFGARFLGIVLHVAIVPERVNEDAVFGFRARGLALKAKVTLTEAQDAVVSGNRSGRGLGFRIGPDRGDSLGHFISKVD